MALRILVVDDAGFVRDTIKRTLRKMLPKGEILEAIDGRKAKALLAKHKIDIILSDWEMPEVTGKELLDWVREQDHLKKTPFIMITSRGDKQNVVEAVKSGVNDYISKPFTPDELQRKVVKQLKRLGITPNNAQANGLTASSADLLTGAPKKAAIQKPRVVQEAVGFGKPTVAPPKKISSSFNGKAFLRFASVTNPFECGIRDITLQAISGVIIRAEHIPVIFEQAAVDLENADGKTLARLNGYVYAIQANQQTPEAKTLKINIRFVDDDAEKLEILSHIIAGKA